MKNRRSVSLASLGFAAMLALTAAAPSPAPRYPKAFATDLGVTRLIGETDSDAVLSGLQIFVSAGLDRETASTSGVASLVAECVLRTPVSPIPGTLSSASGVTLRDAIAAKGGSLTYTVDGRSVHYYLESRSDNLASIVALFAKALAAPDFSTPTLAAGRASLGARIVENEGNALSVGIAMFRRAYYTSAAGMPALGSVATLAGLSMRDVAAFHQANYKRSGVKASVVGRPAPDLNDSIKALVSGLPDGNVTAVVPRSKVIPAEAPRIIAHRDVNAPWVVVGFAAPAPNSRDFGAMLVLEKLLADAFERNSVTTLGFIEKSMGAFYLYDAAPASLVVYVNGTQADPSMTLRQLLVVAKSLSVKPLGAEPLRRFKAAAEGQFLTDSVTLSDRSYLLGTFEAEGLGDDSINSALDALERTTGADVQRVAKAYLQRYIVALVLPRQVRGQ